MVNCYQIIFKVNRLPAQTHDLTSAQAVEGCHQNRKFTGIALGRFKQFLQFRNSVKRSRVLLPLRSLHLVHRVRNDQIMLHRIFHCFVDIGVKPLDRRTFQLQLVETVTVEILNVQRSNTFECHAKFTEVGSNSLFDIIYISRISVYLHRVFDDTQPLDHIVGEKNVAGNGRLGLRLSMNHHVLIRVSGLSQ